MVSFTKKEQIGILLVVLIVALSLGLKFVVSDNIKPEDEISANNDENLLLDDFKETVNTLESTEVLQEGTAIMIHISGQVYYPGLYELVTGDRVNDAVNLAGGLTSSADFDRINLAKKVVDEEKIYIPEIGEELNGEVAGLILDNSSSSLFENPSTSSINSADNGKININTCSKEQLVSLPGIGDVIADRIIEYRNSNQFRNIDEIKNVSGIGDKKYEGIKEMIIVN